MREVLNMKAISYYISCIHIKVTMKKASNPMRCIKQILMLWVVQNGGRT